MEANLYKSVLRTLSLIPEEYLGQVNSYLDKLKAKISDKEKNRKEILALAGGWSEMNEDEFDDYLGYAKESGKDLFGREVDL